MKKETICGIYKITSPTGRVYIGESVDIVRRWREYKCLRESHQPKIFNSFNKHGYEQHIFEILEECDYNDLLCRERFWQEEYDATGKMGLNCALTSCEGKKREYNEEERRVRQLNWHNSNPVVHFETRVEYISLAEACRTLNLNYRLENLRLFNKSNTSLFFKKHDPFEKEIVEPVVCFVTGKVFKTLNLACETLNLEYLKEYERIRKKSYTAKFYYEKNPFERKNIYVSFETGEEYAGLVLACKETGEDYTVQAYSIASKYSTAKFYIKGKKFKRLITKVYKKAICFNTGEVFDNISIACKNRSLEYGKERSRTRTKNTKASFYYEGEFFERTKK